MTEVYVAPEVAEAIAANAPVVALESTVIAHGLPRPQNLDLALDLEARLRAAGVTPATVAVVDGRVEVGLDHATLKELATSDDVAKVSLRDLAHTVVRGTLGATTVAATVWAAASAGIAMMATGGIGGVHRGPDFDESTDMIALSRHPLGVVCSGAKSILDLPRTLERLETLGIPVVGYGTDRLPAFYARDSGLSLAARVDDPREAARLLDAQRRLGLSAAIVFTNPPPDEVAMDRSEMDGLIAEAVLAAETAGVRGKAASPFLLRWIAAHSDGKALAANLGLLRANTDVAGAIAKALAGG